jgi:ribosome-associated translation inhibitor RaiA/DNA-directed RNA polymerase specialized sigma24 family protein
MQHAVEFKNVEPTPDIKNRIETLVARIRKKTQSLAPDPVFLTCAVEQVPVHKLFRVSITLDVPQKTLAAKEEAHDADAAIRAAFEETERQLDAYKASLREEQWWKQTHKRKELRRLKIGGGESSNQDREWFFALVNPHLEKLNDVVRYVLAMMEARGDLPAGALDPEDIVGTVLLRAYDAFSKDPAQGDIRSRLIRFALKAIEAEVRRGKNERDQGVPVEHGVPETPPQEEVTRLGEDVLYFYQPDEVLKVEDVIPDLETPSPEQEVEQKELRGCVRRALRAMPKSGSTPWYCATSSISVVRSSHGLSESPRRKWSI